MAVGILGFSEGKGVSYGGLGNFFEVLAGNWMFGTSASNYFSAVFLSLNLFPFE